MPLLQQEDEMSAMRSQLEDALEESAMLNQLLSEKMSEVATLAAEKNELTRKLAELREQAAIQAQEQAMSAAAGEVDVCHISHVLSFTSAQECHAPDGSLHCGAEVATAEHPPDPLHAPPALTC